jgi:hypothetical protein
MKTTVAFPVSILFLCAVAVSGSAWGGVPSTARVDAETSGSAIHVLEKGCGCADVARTEIFRTKGLEYIASREFADAIVAVAGGASEYSPSEIPASWRAVAAEWSAPGRTKLPGNEEACAPALLYLASLEYRARLGNDRIAPVFPRVARASTRDFRNGLAFRKGVRCFND